MIEARQHRFDSAATTLRGANSAMPVAVSTGGGQACHSRVQVKDEPNTPWRCVGTFQRVDQAEDCVQTLSADGVQARIVRFRIAPVAG